MKRVLQGVVAALVVIMAGSPSAGYTTPTATNAVRDWNVTALGAIAADKESAPATVRTMAMVHVGIYDAVQAIITASNSHPFALNGGVLYHVSPHASLDSAVAAAARTILLGLVPGQAPAIEAAYASALAQIPDSHDKDEGIRVGSWVGDTIVVARSGDGANLALPYTQPSGPGVFQPVPPATAIGTQWPQVRPVLLRSASQFRPGPPPALTSAQYAADYNEIKSIGAANSATRTPDQTQIALFWLDDDAYEWNTVARTVAAEKGTTLVQDARTFALLNVAMLDAINAVFDAKYTYNFWRPQAAIRAGDMDGNPDTVGDPSWTSLRPAPAHPDYPAAHPATAGAATTVLASIFGDATSFSFTTRTAPNGAVRSYTSFSQAAEENAASRVYVGFHFRNSVNTGLTLGRKVGQWTLDHAGTIIPATSMTFARPFVTPVGAFGVSASFGVSFISTAPGQGYVYFGTGPGCSGLVEVATQDYSAGTIQHSVIVTGNDLPGTVGDNGITPGATYWFEAVTRTASGLEVDDHDGKCYSVTIPKA